MSGFRRKEHACDNFDAVYLSDDAAASATKPFAARTLRAVLYRHSMTDFSRQKHALL